MTGFPKSVPRLETTRLVLREITQADTAAIFRNFSDPEVAQWFLTTPCTHIAQATQFMEAFWSEFEAGKGITWAVELKATGTCVGTCGYGEVLVGDRGEVGFDLDKRHWGQGLMAEALAAVIDYGFEHLHLDRVEAHSYSTNLRALRLLEKLGFHVERIADDSHYVVLTKADWGPARP